MSIRFRNMVRVPCDDALFVYILAATKHRNNNPLMCQTPILFLGFPKKKGRNMQWRSLH